MLFRKLQKNTAYNINGDEKMSPITAQLPYTPEEQTRMEIRNFINEGLKDVENNDLYDFDEVFDELESRYAPSV